MQKYAPLILHAAPWVTCVPIPIRAAMFSACGFRFFLLVLIYLTSDPAMKNNCLSTECLHLCPILKSTLQHCPGNNGRALRQSPFPGIAEDVALTIILILHPGDWWA